VTVRSCNGQQYICVSDRHHGLLNRRSSRYREGASGPDEENLPGAGNTIQVSACPTDPREHTVPEPALSVEPHETGVVVAVAGELDVTSSQRFSDCLAEAGTHGARVVLDMSRVDFMDTTALAVIVGAWRRQVEDGGLFLLAGARYRYTKALWITGLADRIPMYDDVETALVAVLDGADPDEAGSGHDSGADAGGDGASKSSGSGAAAG
jgi:anti-anti-sigma factor